MDQRGLHRNAWIGLPEAGRSAHRGPFPARRQKEGGGCVISQGIERMRVLSIDDVLLGCERRTTDDGERIATEAASGRRAKRLGSARREKAASAGPDGTNWAGVGITYHAAICVMVTRGRVFEHALAGVGVW